MPAATLHVVLSLTTATETYLFSLVGQTPISDDPNDRSSRAYLIDYPRLSLQMPRGTTKDGLTISDGLAGGLALPNRQQLSAQLANPLPPDGTTRPMDWLLDERIEDREATVYYCSTVDGASPVMDLSDASWESFGVKIERAVPVDDRIEIALKPLADDLRGQDLNIRTFRGTGDSCLELESAGSDAVEIAAGSVFHPDTAGVLSSDFQYDLVPVIWKTGDLSAGQDLLVWGDGSTTGILLETVATDALKFSCFGLAVTNVTTANNAITEDLPYTISVQRSGSNLRIIINGEISATATGATGTITDPGTVIFSIGGQNSDIAGVREFRFHSVAQTTETNRSWHRRDIIPAEVPGFVEGLRTGTASPFAWLAISDSANDLGPTELNGSPDFVYGGEGEIGAQGTHPYVFGDVLFRKPRLVSQGSQYFVLHAATITNPAVYVQGQLAVKATDYTNNSPFAGHIDMINLFGDNTAVRASFTGHSVTDGEDLLKDLLSDSGIGNIAAADLATTFIIGPALDQAMGFCLPSKVDGWDAAEVLQRFCAGAGLVLTQDGDGKYVAHRTPPQPWDVDSETEVTLIEGKHFDRAALSLQGYVSWPPIHAAYVRFGVVWDPSDFSEVDFSVAATDIVPEMSRTHSEADWQRDKDFRDANPHALDGTLLESWYVNEGDAKQEARIRAHTNLAVHGCRRFQIRELASHVSGMNALGKRVLLRSDKHGDTDGVPCWLTGLQAPFGQVRLMELREARRAPTSIGATTNFNVTVPEISDNPLHVSTDFADSTGTPCNFVSLFDEPPTINSTVTHIFRLRIGADGGDVNLFSIGLYDDGIGIRNIFPFVFEGEANYSTSVSAWVIADGDTAVFYAEWETAEVADFTGVGAGFNATEGAGATCRIYAIDWLYRVR